MKDYWLCLTETVSTHLHMQKSQLYRSYTKLHEVVLKVAQSKKHAKAVLQYTTLLC